LRPLNSISGGCRSSISVHLRRAAGNLIAATTYSADGGAGVQDFIVFIMSSGDVNLLGNDPSARLNCSWLASMPVGAGRRARGLQLGSEAFLTTFR